MSNVIHLLLVLPLVFADGLSQRERYELLGFFTRIRKEVDPPASNMNLLRYSPKMEELALDWVSHCLFQYPGSADYPQFNG
uniref:SCP domain-containing protein n=1 Tax=Mesocestoides corti TaxID=53468 RepID=A0A5K3G0K5_MESCO